MTNIFQIFSYNNLVFIRIYVDIVDTNIIYCTLTNCNQFYVNNNNILLVLVSKGGIQGNELQGNKKYAHKAGCIATLDDNANSLAKKIVQPSGDVKTGPTVWRSRKTQCVYVIYE